MDKSYLINMELPPKYVDSAHLFSNHTLDGLPDLREYLLNGRTRKEHEKLMKLYTIENTKRAISEVISETEDYETIRKAVEIGRKYVEKAIQEYNDL